MRIVIDHRIRRAERLDPERAWPTDLRVELPGLVDRQALRRHLRDTMTDEHRGLLQVRCNRLRDREFERLDGTWGDIRDWHSDPGGAHRYPLTHWSRVSEAPGVDLKRVWHAARFGWAFDLARQSLLESDCVAKQTFWSVLEEWMHVNPPATGVHWNCGQEASVRLLAVVLSVEAMESTLDPHQRGLVGGLAEVTAERVCAHIGYAESQANNHLSSEAMGLALAISLLPTHPRVGQWKQAMDRALAIVADELVYADGGTSQYSINYHRVFVEAFAVLEILHRSGRITVKPEARSAFERAARVLPAVCDSTQPSAPFIGHDDGGRLLPSARGHRDLSESCELVAALWSVPRVASASDGSHEQLAWLGLDMPDRPPVQVRRAVGRDVHVMEQFGLVVVRFGEVSVWLRAGPFRHRPSHADQLNLEIWYQGRAVTVDRGTHVYTGAGAGAFSESTDHSTPNQVGRGHMLRASRFLWAGWNDGHIDEVVECADSVKLIAHTNLRNGTRFERMVVVGHNFVEVLDTCNLPDRDWESRWQLAEQSSDFSLQQQHGDERVNRQARAQTYGRLVSDVATVVRRPQDGVVRSVFTTLL